MTLTVYETAEARFKDLTFVASCVSRATQEDHWDNAKPRIKQMIAKIVDALNILY